MSTLKKTRFVIRAARQDDLAPCLALDHDLETQLVWQMRVTAEENATQIAFQTLRLPRAIRVEYPRDAELLERELGDMENVLVAEANNVLLGYVQIALTESDHSAWIPNLVVGQPFRRRRIGRALFEQACTWSRERKARHITVEATTRSYPAIRFLLAQGLIFCGFNDRYYSSQAIAIYFGRNL